LLNAADCLILTSSLEGSPNAVKEALMCNLPVISTAVGDVGELLAGVAPSWICAATVDQFASALTECMSDRRRSNGRDVAAALDEGRVARRILKLYDEVGA
jgi:glycosyltransferase involved in cell wall biosynthesis